MTDSSPVSAERGLRPLELLIEVPAVVVTFVMMVHITLNALLRTVIHQPLPNTLEIVQYWYVPIVAFLGFIAAQHRGQHIAADLVFQVLPSVTKRYALALMLVLSAAVTVGFAWFGWGEAMHAMEIGKTAGVSTVISWPTYFLVPLAFASLTAQFLWAAVQAVTHPERDHMVGDLEEELVLEQVAADLEKK